MSCTFLESAFEDACAGASKDKENALRCLLLHTLHRDNKYQLHTTYHSSSVTLIFVFYPPPSPQHPSSTKNPSLPKMVFGKFCVYTAGPNTALVKSSGRRDVRIVIGGRILAVPVIQRVDSLGLELRTITVHTVRGTTKNGVGVDVTSCCQVKIQGWSSTAGESPAQGSASAGGDLQMDYSAIRLAAQHFIGKNDSEIEDTIQKTIAGHQRAIIGVLTVEELISDRAAFSQRVLDLCHVDMRNMGLTVVSYTVAEITDENGYINALGVTQTEVVQREATEGAAEHQSQARSRKAQEEAAAHLSVNKQKERMIDSDKHRQITQADAQKDVDRRVAVQQKAGQISHAEQDAILLVERQKAMAAEAKAELQVLEQKVEKAKLTKQRDVHVEADAKLYKAKVDADGIRATAQADADRIRSVGEAEADSIRAKGKAEIDVLRARVKVWQEWYVIHFVFLDVPMSLRTLDSNVLFDFVCSFYLLQWQPSGNLGEDDRGPTEDGCRCCCTFIKDREDGVHRIWRQRWRWRTIPVYSRNGAHHCRGPGNRQRTHRI